MKSTLERAVGRRRFFTAEQAGAALPLVRAIVADLVGLAREVSERAERLSVVLAGRDLDCEDSDPYVEELRATVGELERDRGRLRELVDELLELGVEPISVIEGLVDFPAVLAGQKGYLRWRLDEPGRLRWRERRECN